MSENIELQNTFTQPESNEQDVAMTEEEYNAHFGFCVDESVDYADDLLDEIIESHDEESGIVFPLVLDRLFAHAIAQKLSSGTSANDVIREVLDYIEMVQAEWEEDFKNDNLEE